MTTRPEMLLWLSDARGIYIPRDFANSFRDRAHTVDGVTDDNWAVLESGPDHEWYWEAWDEVLQDAIVQDENGHLYRVWQDGDCWLIPEGMEYNEEQDAFMWPEDVTEEPNPLEGAPLL